MSSSTSNMQINPDALASLKKSSKRKSGEISNQSSTSSSAPSQNQPPSSEAPSHSSSRRRSSHQQQHSHHSSSSASIPSAPPLSSSHHQHSSSHHHHHHHHHYHVSPTVSQAELAASNLAIATTGAAEASAASSAASSSNDYHYYVQVASPDGKEVQGIRGGAGDESSPFPELPPHIVVIGKIGEGTFANVYHAVDQDFPQLHFALKKLYTTSRYDRLRNEMQFLHELGGKHFVVECSGLATVGRHHTIVLPYFEHDGFSTYCGRLTVFEVQKYMRALMESLAHVHSAHVIHRDIKPSNFLYSHSKGQYLLVDFGLAERQAAASSPMSLAASAPSSLPSGSSSSSSSSLSSSSSSSSSSLQPSESNGQDPTSSSSSSSSSSAKNEQPPSVTQPPQPVSSSRGARLLTAAGGTPNDVRAKAEAARAGTRGFRAPEVLMKSRHQTVAVDIWSAGVILLSLMSGRYPIFQAPEDLQSLRELYALLGAERFTGLPLGKYIHWMVYVPTLSWQQIVQILRQTNKCPSDLPPLDLCMPFPDEAYDLLDRLMTVNPDKRITAEEAMKHPFLAGPDLEPKTDGEKVLASLPLRKRKAEIVKQQLAYIQTLHQQHQNSVSSPIAINNGMSSNPSSAPSTPIQTPRVAGPIDQESDNIPPGSPAQ